MLLVSSPLSLLSVFFFSVSSALIISPTLYLIQCSQMAAFSYQHLPSILDMSVFLPNSSIKMSGSLEEGYINNISTCFPYSSPTEQFHEIPAEKQRTDSSSIVVDLDLEGSSDQATQMVSPKRKNTETSCLSSAESKDSKRSKPKKQRNCCGKNKQTEKKKSKDEKKNQKKNPEAPPGGYVHVRARRGEATDSHSLAERVRRERISERLKLLQSLVPGCDKVTSKALMLDEIINYVQSLQHQVEFLSMKLTSLSPMVYDMGGLDMNSICTKPEKLSSLASPLPQAQQTLLNPSSTVAADITAPPFTAAQYYPLLDNSVLSYLPQQQGGQRPNFSYQDIGNLLWEVDEQRQRFLNQSDFTTLCSFQ